MDEIAANLAEVTKFKYLNMLNAFEDRIVKYGREETLTTELNTSHKFEVNFASC